MDATCNGFVSRHTDRSVAGINPGFHQVPHFIVPAEKKKKKNLSVSQEEEKKRKKKEMEARNVASRIIGLSNRIWCRCFCQGTDSVSEDLLERTLTPALRFIGYQIHHLASDTGHHNTKGLRPVSVADAETCTGRGQRVRFMLVNKRTHNSRTQCVETSWVDS